jgi:cell division septation protein DedD
MAIATGGVYLAFNGGPDASAPDRPGIGPYDEIVLRGARAVGERDGFGKVIALRSSAGSWRDAETTSAESNVVEDGRGDLRISAGPQAVVVRFSDDAVAGHAVVPDLGPFSVVVVGTHDVRGDEDTIAVRVSRVSPWQLTDRAGSGFQGAMKDALVFAPSGRPAASQPSLNALPAAPPAAPPTPWSQSPEKQPATNGTPADAGDDAAPSVWVDRAKIAPNIYISRPDKKR